MVAAVAGSPCSPSDFGKGEKFMQVLFLVLNRTEYLETLLERLLESGIHGCTVLDSMGMMRVIDKSGDDLPMFGALRQLFDPARESSKTLMMVLAEDGLDHPDTGIMFAVPALFVEGLWANQQ